MTWFVPAGAVIVLVLVVYGRWLWALSRIAREHGERLARLEGYGYGYREEKR